LLREEASYLGPFGLRLEGGLEIRASAASLAKIQSALEHAGVEFIPAEEHKGPGVRLAQLVKPPTAAE
jgi:hypothetical protein